VYDRSHRKNRRWLKARYVFPVAGEPIRDGCVTILGEQILSVGRTAEGSEAEDLGNVAILPGLVNAHTHLDLSVLDKPLGRPGAAFPEWIRQLVGFRRKGPEQGSRGVQLGLREIVRQGTTTLGDIAQPGWPREAFEEAPLQAVVFQELIAPAADRVSVAMERAHEHLRRSHGGRWLAGLSPHAPYSVCWGLLDALVSLSADAQVPLAFHLAESREEMELLGSGRGPLADFLGGLPSWDSSVVAPPARPLDYLRRLSAAHRALVIHGNYLDGDEIALLAENRQRMAVVYCPRTHRYFQHDDYPLSRMLSAGVSVCLGTDSRASSPDLSLLAEMRAAVAMHPAVAPRVILELGTFRAAKALGLAEVTGSLEPGKRADLAVVALPDRDAGDPYELLFDSELPVVAAWHRGRAV
jgi:cytosine/adenosine deaminase-related metal-dependent hydrolase